MKQNTESAPALTKVVVKGESIFLNILHCMKKHQTKPKLYHWRLLTYKRDHMVRTKLANSADYKLGKINAKMLISWKLPRYRIRWPFLIKFANYNEKNMHSWGYDLAFLNKKVL